MIDICFFEYFEHIQFKFGPFSGKLDGHSLCVVGPGWENGCEDLKRFSSWSRGGKCHPPTASGRRNLSVIESRRRPSYLSAWPDEQEEEALGLRSREANNSLCDHRPPTQQKHVLMT